MVISARPEKFGGFAGLEELRREEIIGEGVPTLAPLLAPLGLAFKRMTALIERETDLSAPKWFLLLTLNRHDGISQGEVSEVFEIDPSRVTRIGQSMEADGLVRRERDPDDNRVMRMYLTDQGRLALRNVSELNELLESRILGVLDEEEVEALGRSLFALAEALR